MPKFKVLVSKNQKKYTILLNSPDLVTLKERVHKEWYSILGVEAADNFKIEWNKFLFRWIKDDETKNWIIIWDDIFKVYLKLRRWFWYQVKELYLETDKDKPLEYKSKILRELEEEYKIYVNSFLKEKKVVKVSDDKYEKFKELNLDNFYLKKDLDQAYNLIWNVLKRIDEFLQSKEIILTDEDRRSLIESHNLIVSLKKSTNISKLREIWEDALMKIWKIELSKLEKKRSKYFKNLLWETNKLLRQFWSSKQFVEKGRSIKYIILGFFTWLFEKDPSDLDQSKKSKNKKSAIDKTSYTFVKSTLLLKKYKKRSLINRKDLIKNFYTFILPFWKLKEIRDNILIKRKVIKQNISLLKAKQSWKTFSYTRIKNSYYNFINILFTIKDELSKYTFLVIFLYSLVFIFYINFYSFFSTDLNFNGLFYFIVLVLVYIFLFFSKWIISLVINFVFLYFIVIFALINF